MEKKRTKEHDELMDQLSDMEEFLTNKLSRLNSMSGARNDILKMYEDEKLYLIALTLLLKWDDNYKYSIKEELIKDCTKYAKMFIENLKKSTTHAG